MINKSTLTNLVTKIKDGQRFVVEDDLTVEEPLEIRVKYQAAHGVYRTMSVAVTMRTPGCDQSLVRGFLFTEGIVADQDQIISIDIVEDNIIVVSLGSDVSFDPPDFSRNFYTSSSCGVCGKASIDSIHSDTIHLPWRSNFTIADDTLCKLPEMLYQQQDTFGKTGGIHACALIDQSGNFIDVKEDVGRHNAMDKLIGGRSKYPLHKYMVLVSGRASFELIQKASKAGIGLLAAIGAPSSLAVALAEQQGMTLVGFLKKNSFNIYTKPKRVTSV